MFELDEFSYILENDDGDVFVGADGRIYLRRGSLMKYEQPYYLERCAVCGKEPILKSSFINGDYGVYYCCHRILSRGIAHNIEIGSKKSEKEARNEWNILMLAIKNDGKY